MASIVVVDVLDLPIVDSIPVTVVYDSISKCPGCVGADELEIVIANQGRDHQIVCRILTRVVHVIDKCLSGLPKAVSIEVDKFDVRVNFQDRRDGRSRADYHTVCNRWACACASTSTRCNAGECTVRSLPLVDYRFPRVPDIVVIGVNVHQFRVVDRVHTRVVDDKLSRVPGAIVVEIVECQPGIYFESGPHCRSRARDDRFAGIIETVAVLVIDDRFALVPYSITVRVDKPDLDVTCLLAGPGDPNVSLGVLGSRGMLVHGVGVCELRFRRPCESIVVRL